MSKLKKRKLKALLMMQQNSDCPQNPQSELNAILEANLTNTTTYGGMDCAHNKRSIKLKNGAQLRGHSGKHHQELLEAGKATGVNIITASMYFPDDVFFTNDHTLVPSGIAPPTQRVVCFSVADQKTPRYDEEFGLLLAVIEAELSKPDGIVRISCQGGHGRTGTVMAVAYGRATGSQTPIEDIRRLYCNKAVESFKQKQYVHRWLGLEEPKEDPKPMPMCVYGPCRERVLQLADKYCDEHTKNPPPPTMPTCLNAGCYRKCAAEGDKQCQDCLSGNKPTMPLPYCSNSGCFARVAVRGDMKCQQCASGGPITRYQGGTSQHHVNCSCYSCKPPSTTGGFGGAVKKVAGFLTGNVVSITKYMDDGSRLTDGATDEEVKDMALGKMTDGQYQRYTELIGVVR